MRRSGRASMPNKKYSSIAPPVARPEHRSPAPIDATLWSTRYLQRQGVQNKPWFRHLDFVKMDVGGIKTILWTDAVEKKYGEFVPPPLALRRDPKMIRDFFRSGLTQRRGLCNKYSSFDDDEYLKSLYSPDVTGDWCDVDEEGRSYPCADLAIDDVEEGRSYPCADLAIDDVEEGRLYPCAGLTIDGIMASQRLDDARKEEIAFGYKHIVREGFVAKANLFNPESFRWDNDLWGGADGVVASGIGASCRVDWLVHVEPPFDETFKCASVRDVACSKVASEGGGACNECAATRKRLLRRCTQTADLRRKPLSQYTNNNQLSRTPSLINQKAVKQAEKIHSLRSSYHGKLYRKWSHRHGVSVHMNEASDSIFSDEVAANVVTFLSEDVTKSSVAKYVFLESVRKHKVARASGVTSVNHCPIAVRLGALIRGKMGYSGGVYDLVASALGLPTDRRLQDYTIPTTNEPDGLLLANILREAELFDQRNPNAGPFDWERHVSLAFDAMTCKGSFVVNYHTNEIVGLGVDCMKLNVILKELKEIEKFDKSDKDLEEDAAGNKTEESVEVPEPAKHFLIFAATTWSPTAQNGKPSRHQFVCARYGLGSIDANFLIPVIRKIILHLSLYGFLVDTIAGDGASENRSAFKTLATLTAYEVLKGRYPADLLGSLNSSTKIAFPHPNPEYAGEIYIFIGGDMPHWVKKFRNATEEWETIIEVLEKVDRTVDIINCRRDRGFECIDCPQHKHIYELFSVLQLFEEWKEDAGGFTFEFITRQTYEDLQWMVFGIAGIACRYLNPDKSRKMHQGRSGSDVCEHFFAKVRQNNSNPTLAQCRAITSKISGLSISSNNLFNFRNKSNTAGIKRNHCDYFEPVPSRKKSK